MTDKARSVVYTFSARSLVCLENVPIAPECLNEGFRYNLVCSLAAIRHFRMFEVLTGVGPKVIYLQTNFRNILCAVWKLKAILRSIQFYFIRDFFHGLRIPFLKGPEIYPDKLIQ